MATDAMSYDPLTTLPPELQPVVDHLVTEDDTPVESIFHEKQQSLLTRTLHSSWPGPGEGRSFVAMSNVGFFYSIHSPAIVPDALLSLNVALPANVWPKRARSYFLWEYGKAPKWLSKSFPIARAAKTPRRCPYMPSPVRAIT